MSLIIHSPERRKTIQWASGSSTEMFIFPSDGSFADRDFLFRISTASVEAEESTFTFFEGITRHLMILKGQLELIHAGRYSRQLEPFDQDVFSGEWDTRSKGRVTDLNLMLKGGADGGLSHHVLRPGTVVSFPRADAAFFFVYIASGSFLLSDGSQVSTGDLIEVIQDAGFPLQGDGDVVVIRVSA